MAGGACVARKMLFHRLSHGGVCGQYAGSRNTGRRCGLTSRAGTLTSWRRRVAPRAGGWLPPVRVAAARNDGLLAATVQTEADVLNELLAESDRISSDLRLYE